MSYYDTLDDDLNRAKEILKTGKATPDEFSPDLSPELREHMIAQSGTIYGADTYAAYKLLESFVEEIERNRKALTAIAADDGCWSDGNGIREDGSLAFARVQALASRALTPHQSRRRRSNGVS